MTTEAKRTETALTESEGRFRAVMQSAAEAIICADRQGCILFWNRAAERLFGYSERDVLGQPLLIIMPPRFREAHQERLMRYERTGEVAVIDRTIEVEGLRKDGKEFPIELSIGTWGTKEGAVLQRDRARHHRSQAMGSATSPAANRSAGAPRFNPCHGVVQGLPQSHYQDQPTSCRINSQDGGRS